MQNLKNRVLDLEKDKALSVLYEELDSLLFSNTKNKQAKIDALRQCIRKIKEAKGADWKSCLSALD